MIDNDHGNGNMSSSLGIGSSFQDNYRDHKRLRASSISGRLRTASDLEECGWIDKSQKGILKDLIISGNMTLQHALDKFSSGDTSELQDLIRQGLFSRRQSVDLLEGLDLDFLNVDTHSLTDFGNFGSSSQGNSNHMNHRRNSEDFSFDTLPKNLMENILPGSSTGGDWYDHHGRTSSIVSALDFPLTSLRKNSLLSGDLKDWSSIDYSDHIVHTSEIFDDDNVDLSMYELMAASLQKSTPTTTTTATTTTTTTTTSTSKTSKAKSSNKANHGSSSSTSKQQHSTVKSSDSNTSLTGLSNNNTTNNTLKGNSNNTGLKKNNTNTSSTSNLTHDTNNNLLLQSGSNSSMNNNHMTSTTTTTTNGSNGVPSYGSSSSTSFLTASSSTLHDSILHPTSSSSSSSSSALLNTNHNNTINKSLSNNNLIPSTQLSNNDGNLSTMKFTSSINNPGGLGTGGGPHTLLSSLSHSHPHDETNSNTNNTMKVQTDFIGAYSPESRRARIERFIEKRNRRVWTKKVKYDVRKNFADSRLRVKGRFVKKEDEELMRELLTI